MVAMKSNNAILVCIVYRGHHGDGICSTQPPMCGDHRYHYLDVIISLPAEDMIDNIEEEVVNDTEIWHTNRSSFLIMSTGFPKFDMMVRRRIIT